MVIQSLHVLRERKRRVNKASSREDVTRNKRAEGSSRRGDQRAASVASLEEEGHSGWC